MLVFHPTQWDPSWVEYVRAYNRLISAIPGADGARLLSVAGSGAWHSLTFDDSTVELPVVCFDTGPVAERYGVAGGSAVFVIDDDGRVSWRHSAPDSLASPNDVAQALTALRPADEPEQPTEWTRRRFVATTLAAVLALAFTAATRARPTRRRAKSDR